MLTHGEARRVYDRIGPRQDTQRFYENPALRQLIDHGDFGGARAVFELGCGTGSLAAELLAEYLPPEARYRGVDLSPRMVELARSRLEPFASRAEVVLSDGSPPAGEPTAGYDRFLTTYVLDLLPEGEIRAMLGEAHRMLAPGGLLCAAGLTTGCTTLSRGVVRVWRWLHRLSPALVGGCRPVELPAYLDEARGGAQWTLLFHRRMASFGVPSEVVVARPGGGPAPPGGSGPTVRS